MEVKFYYDDLNKIVKKYLEERNYEIKEEPELLVDNCVGHVRAEVEIKLGNERINTEEKEAEEIAQAILESNFWMAGLGHFDLSFEQVSEVIKVALQSENQEERVNKMSNFYEEWRL